MLNTIFGITNGESFESILKRNRGMGPGFDFLRIALAVILFFGHAKWIAGEQSIALLFTEAGNASQEWVGFTRPIKLALVPAFFALSGFLVMGSAFRLRTTSTFLAHRVLRILPALLVEVTLSALILGPVFTTLPLKDYFSASEFFHYFGNILGLVTFTLPGVFEHNPVRGIVNINLWTLPAEFHCYLLTALLLLSRTVYNRKWFTIGFGVATLILSVMHAQTGFSNPLHGPFPPHVAVYYFFAGVLAFHYQEKIPVHYALFLGCAALCYVCLMFNSLIYLVPLPLTYCTLFIGMMAIPKHPIISSGDYSYGIYLYGFPISQAYMQLYPQLADHMLLFYALTFTTTYTFALASWHLIEKRCLGLKKHLPAQFFPVPAREK